MEVERLCWGVGADGEVRLCTPAVGGVLDVEEVGGGAGVVAGEEALLGLVEDVVVGGPVEVAVAVGPDVVAVGDYFVELV